MEHHRVDELLARIRDLEEELEAEFRARREQFQFIIEEQRVRFAEELERLQRRQRIGLWRYLREAPPLFILTAPVTYAGFIPFALIDLFVSLFQAVCFPVYGIPRVKRRDYLVFDRADLPYLNAVEQFNCFYCSYANGLAAYVREVAARTEQYWCPIKHARRIRAAHGRYPRFFEFGDAEAYRKGLERLRKQYEGASSG